MDLHQSVNWGAHRVRRRACIPLVSPLVNGWPPSETSEVRAGCVGACTHTLGVIRRGVLYSLGSLHLSRGCTQDSCLVRAAELVHGWLEMGPRARGSRVPGHVGVCVDGSTRLLGSVMGSD